MHKQQGWPQAWEYCQAKPIQTLGRASQGVNWSWSQCIKSHHTQTSSGKELPNHFWNRNIVRSILPGLKRKRTGLLLSGPKSSYISFVNQGLEEDWRGTESKLLEVQCKVSEVSDDLGCCDVCWCWFIVFYQVQSQLSIYQEILELFMLPSADKLYGDADFLFQQDFSTCPHCQTHFKWSADYDITVLDWPDNMPDLNPIWNIWYIFRRKMRNSGSNNTDELNSASAVPPADRFHSLLTDAGVCAKGAPTKYWVQKLSYFKELGLFCFENPFLIDFRKYSNILKYWIFDFH